MKKNLMLLFVILLFTGLPVFSQMRSESDSTVVKTDFILADKHFTPKLYLGVGVGFANMFGDFSNSVIMPAARLGMGCRFTSNLMLDAEAYFGQLSSRQPAGSWATTAFSETSTFQAVDINIKFTLGNYIQYPHSELLKILSGLYIGVGVGYISSHISSFKGNYTTLDVNYKMDSSTFTKMNISTAYIPLDLGLRIPIKKFLGTSNTQFMLNYQINYTFSDYVDGLKPLVSRNQFNDCYTVFTAGLSFHLSKK